MFGRGYFCTSTKVLVRHGFPSLAVDKVSIDMTSGKPAWRICIYHFNISVAGNSDVFVHLAVQMLYFKNLLFVLKILDIGFGCSFAVLLFVFFLSLRVNTYQEVVGFNH